MEDRTNSDRALPALTLQLLGWIAEEERTYADTMDAWRTSCPRLSVWEDAQAAGLVHVVAVPGATPRVALTELGCKLLAQHAKG